MLWIYIALGLCLLFIVLPAILGSFMKRQHTCTSSAWLNASVPEVWKAITDREASLSWRKDLKSIVRIAPYNGSEAWRETGRNGQALELASTSSVPDKEATWTIINNRSFGGDWVFVLTPENNGTRLEITENGFVNNVVLRFMFRTFFKSSASVDKFLAMLEAYMNK